MINGADLKRIVTKGCSNPFKVRAHSMNPAIFDALTGLHKLNDGWHVFVDDAAEEGDTMGDKKGERGDQLVVKEKIRVRQNLALITKAKSIGEDLAVNCQDSIVKPAEERRRENGPGTREVQAFGINIGLGDLAPALC